MREPNPRLALARRRKAELLPQITRLRAEGRSARQIARTVGVPKFHLRWQQSLRRGYATRSAAENMEMIVRRERVWDWNANAVLDHIVVDQLVRKTSVFCEQKRLEMAGIEAEPFQELLVHEFRRQFNIKRCVYSRFHRICAHVIKSDTSPMVSANSTMSGIKRPKKRKKSRFWAIWPYPHYKV